MNLIGEVVKHKAFGKGVITEFSNSNVTILFENGSLEKKFVYPIAFESFLKLENEELQNKVKEEQASITEVLEKERQEFEYRINLKSIQSAKVNKPNYVDKCNIAFKCNYCDGGLDDKTVGFNGICSDEMKHYNIKVAKHVWCSQPENMCNKFLSGEITKEELENFYQDTNQEFSKSVCYESQLLGLWTAGAGVVQSGKNKGKPMVLKNVSSNSLALLTSKEPQATEEDRFIFALFLVDENHEGNAKSEGFVSAHSKYKMRFSMDEAKKLKFWDYYFNPNKPEKIILGSGLHRYFSDEQAAQVLKKVCEIKRGTEAESEAQTFLEYFCQIKGIDIERISAPKGGLKRH